MSFWETALGFAELIEVLSKRNRSHQSGNEFDACLKRTAITDQMRTFHSNVKLPVVQRRWDARAAIPHFFFNATPLCFLKHFNEEY